MKKISLVFLLFLIVFTTSACQNNNTDHDSDDWFLAIDQNDMTGYLNSYGETMIPFVYTAGEPFVNGYAKVVKETGEGIIDEKGIYLIEPKYSRVKILSQESKYFAYKNDIKGYILIDDSGKVLIDNEEIDDFFQSNIEGLFIASNNLDLYGLIDSSNNMILDFSYDYIYRFQYNHIAKVKKDGLYGYINDKGESILECEYLTLDVISDKYISAFDGNSWHLFNLRGEEVFDITSLSSFSALSESIFYYNDKGFTGIVNSHGNVIRTPIYRSVTKRNGNQEFTILFNDDTQIIFNSDGQVLFQTTEYNIIFYNEEYILLKDKTDDKYSVFDYDGRVLLGPTNNILSFVYDVNQDYVLTELIVNQDIENYNVYDKNLDLTFNHNFNLSTAIFNVEKEVLLIDKSKMIDFKNNTVLDIPNSELTLYSEYILVTQNGLTGLYDYSGNKRIPIKYKLLYNAEVLDYIFSNIDYSIDLIY